MKKQPFARIEEGFFNFVTDYVNQPNTNMQQYLVPKGGIIIWSGAANAIPTGWALCDGTNGTPDLRGRFVLGGIAGTGTNSIGNRGGVSEINIQPFNLPDHNHNVQVSLSGNTNITGDHSHATNIAPDGVGGGNLSFGSMQFDNPNMIHTNTTGNHFHSISLRGNFYNQ